MCVCVCVCVCVAAGGQVKLRSNNSSEDQVFEEEGGGRGGLGVEPVLSTSYSANDVNHLEEEVTLAYLSAGRKKQAVPR